MRRTDFDELFDKRPAAVNEQLAVAYSVTGSPITADEVSSRLASNLYLQLADGDETSVVRAAERATKHIGAIASGKGRTLDLDDEIQREIVLDMTIYELHMALGHEEAGREYRLKAKDLFFAAFDDGATATAQDSKVPAAAVKTAHRRRYP